VGEIENPMVIDTQWRHNEQPEQKIFGECAGCENEIFTGDDYYEIKTSNEILMVHQNAMCCMEFVSEMAWCKTAGEE
jgi:hypothetical protein